MLLSWSLVRPWRLRLAAATESANNTMNVDENLTTDMNAVDMNADMNAVDANMTMNAADNAADAANTAADAANTAADAAANNAM